MNQLEHLVELGYYFFSDVDTGTIQFVFQGKTFFPHITQEQFAHLENN